MYKKNDKTKPSIKVDAQVFFIETLKLENCSRCIYSLGFELYPIKRRGRHCIGANVIPLKYLNCKLNRMLLVTLYLRCHFVAINSW